ncbi:MAG: uroporphyrinogen-III synthase [Nitriliruptor sp.]|uniref:uroporphyrinogen-III synthase n=1 Tax=Nitriliruptor sp. TaxID=2448056 RepID=UPI0034A03CA3
MAAAGAPGPLRGRRVLVTRPPHQAAELSDRIRAAGGIPIEAPTITTVPGDPADLRAAVDRLAAGAYAGVCLTSANGVHALARAFRDAGIDPAPALRASTLVGAVGPRTAALVGELLGVRPTVVPDTATGAALGRAVPAGAGEVLLPRGDLAGRDLDAALSAAGWTPVPVVAYRTVTAERLAPEVLDALADGHVDLLSFTSASTVRGFVTLIGSRSWSGRVVTIGPVTSAACRELGIEAAVEADPHDLGGLLDALAGASGTSVGPEHRAGG